MTDGKNPLNAAELEKRDRLRKEKPLVYEKILRYDEKMKRGESVAIV